MLPIVSGKEVVKALLKNGFELKRQTGSHVHLMKHANSKTLHVTIPIHGNKDLNPFVIRSIIRQSGYSVEEFVGLLK
jgi:predicted RNA binding protein YcfA (HicA-like mRNA interferase family)